MPSARLPAPCPPVGSATSVASAHRRTSLTMGLASAVSRASFTTAPQTTRTPVQMTPAPVVLALAAPVGWPWACSPCSCPAYAAIYLPLVASNSARRAMMPSNGQAAAARTTPIPFAGRSPHLVVSLSPKLWTNQYDSSWERVGKWLFLLTSFFQLPSLESLWPRTKQRTNIAGLAVEVLLGG